MSGSADLAGWSPTINCLLAYGSGGGTAGGPHCGLQKTSYSLIDGRRRRETFRSSSSDVAPPLMLAVMLMVSCPREALWS
jgi:hypothetical protein